MLPLVRERFGGFTGTLCANTTGGNRCANNAKEGLFVNMASSGTGAPSAAARLDVHMESRRAAAGYAVVREFVCIAD